VNEKDIFQELLKLGIIVRPLAPYQMHDYFRITIGTEQENAACLKALKKVLQMEKVV
jgi:histidinol-phosphate aminotransferase